GPRLQECQESTKLNLVLRLLVAVGTARIAVLDELLFGRLDDFPMRPILYVVHKLLECVAGPEQLFSPPPLWRPKNTGEKLRPHIPAGLHREWVKCHHNHSPFGKRTPPWPSLSPRSDSPRKVCRTSETPASEEPSSNGSRRKGGSKSLTNFG